MQELPPGFRIVGGEQSNPDPMIAPPDPYKQQDMRNDERRLDLQEQTTSLQNELTGMKIEEQRVKQQERQEEQAQALRADEAAEYKLIKAIRELSSIALDANDNGGFMETGASGSFARTVLPSGTAGYDLAGDLKTLDANFAFDALNAMREASKTGGALGQVTERELDLLKSSVSNLDPNLSHDVFLGNVEKARQAYLAQLARIDPALATSLGYDGAKAEAALLDLDRRYAEEMGQPRSTVDRSANPDARQSTPEDIEAIMQKYGG